MAPALASLKTATSGTETTKSPVLTSEKSKSPPDVDVREFTEPHWFRVEVHTYGYTDEYGDSAGSYDKVDIKKLEVLKHTPKGAFLNNGFGQRKFVLRDVQHRARAYAAPTLEMARQDFIKRKLYHISKLQDRINRANRQIRAAQGKLV